LDPKLVENAITEKTKAIIAVHLYGYAANMSSLIDIATKYKLLVFEDAAQSHGAMHGDQMTGAWGKMAAFSFYPTKNLGALGDAGCITTNDDGLAEAARSRRSYGQGVTKYDHISSGWNTRLDPLQAAFLEYHLTRLDEWTKDRRTIASSYKSALEQSGVRSMGPIDVNESVWHHCVILVSNRNGAQEWFKSQGISTDIHYPYAAYLLEPVKPYLSKSYGLGSFPVSDSLANSVLSLPIGPWMNEDQIESVCQALRQIPEEFKA
jgi:dTDP-4-amino-4,6-dideoxygalactose transaminase